MILSLINKYLTKQDIITIIKYLIELVNSKAEIDDIDHLSNRSVRTVESNFPHNLVLDLQEWQELLEKE